MLVGYSKCCEFLYLQTWGVGPVDLNYGSDPEHIREYCKFTYCLHINGDTRMFHTRPLVSLSFPVTYSLWYINDTVPMSVWRVGGLRCAECCLEMLVRKS